MEQLIGGSEDISPALIDHFNDRSGYLKPAEGEARLAEVDELLRADIERMIGQARSSKGIPIHEKTEGRSTGRSSGCRVGPGGEARDNRDAPPLLLRDGFE